MHYIFRQYSGRLETFYVSCKFGYKARVRLLDIVSIWLITQPEGILNVLELNLFKLRKEILKINDTFQTIQI